MLLLRWVEKAEGKIGDYYIEVYTTYLFNVFRRPVFQYWNNCGHEDRFNSYLHFVEG